MTDAGGVVTETSYDALDRVVEVRQKGATASEDLVTRNVYNVFGDLRHTILPEGNVIEYGYDGAGRLTSIERKPSVATRGERTFYTLDGFGHRIREDLQSWNGSAWQTESYTGYEYSTRCHLDKVLHADGTETEYG
ncbi:MAG: RHS repeat protein, partial [bacterium]|nr:RHS repeat protein [bacterium]